MPDDETDLSEESRIPLSEVVPVDREDVDDDAEHAVLRIRGNRVGPCRYLVQWADKTSSWELVTKLLSCSGAIAEYWRNPSGLHRIRQIGSRRMEQGYAEQLERWSYDDWTGQVMTGVRTQQNKIAYLAAVQLTDSRHRTQSALVEQLRKGQFLDDAKFTVWVVPQALHTKEGAVLIPVMGVRYAILRKWTTAAEWRSVNGLLVQHHQFLAMGADVPLFWWHSEAQDHLWGFHRDATPDFVSMQSVLMG